MLRNQNIICISSIDWDFIWQGHQEIMSTLAKNGNRVLFIENTGVRPPSIRDIPRLRKRFRDYFKGIKGIREEIHNLYIFSPIVLPFPYARIARLINRIILLPTLNRWMKVLDFADPIIWTFLPTGIALDIIYNINKKLLIYYCIDNFVVSSASAKKIRATERKLLKLADAVFVTSRALYDYCSQHSNKVDIFPFGVNIDNFEKARIIDTQIPAELRNIKKPIIGYVGGVHKWIDQKLVRALAERHPEHSLVFVGPLQADVSILSGVNNIYFLGNKKHRELPNLIKYFSLAMIPYRITEYTKNVYPTKLNEYLAMGKPVVSTALPEIEIFNQKYRDIVYVGRNSEEISGSISRALKEDNETLRRRRIEVAHDNGWQRRIEQMSNIIEKTAERKMLDNEARWKESLLIFYRTTRRRIVRFATIAAITYLRLFYTPFSWYLAEPLRIAQAPQKADAIVVFAGGVGESGRAGQGYEERVGYAVRLYKQGYAQHLVFSSGYVYVFEEPLVMRALAVSLGVPSQAIVLEDRAGNTYENVKFSKEILAARGWEKALVVSSPYHMRRVDLVSKKVAPEIDFVYTPIPQSHFYRRAIRPESKRVYKQINLRQIKALLHEYLGIVYYWWKGWI
ncbi:MAG: ElyC/SanA/YdcF family protein [Candidatus Omnitrophota bacterium]